MVMAVLPLNPVPLTVTTVSEVPSMGVKAIFSLVSKVLVVRLPLVSWTFMAWIPRKLEGMMERLLVKLPLTLVVVTPVLIRLLSK